MPKRTLLNSESVRRVQIAKYLQYHMRELGMSHKELAKAAGMSPSRLRRIGRVTPQSHILQRLGTCIEQLALTRQPPTKTKTV